MLKGKLDPAFVAKRSSRVISMDIKMSQCEAKHDGRKGCHEEAPVVPDVTPLPIKVIVEKVFHYVAKEVADHESKHDCAGSW